MTEKERPPEWAEGYAAGLAGVALSENPYARHGGDDEAVMQKFRWTAGWCAGTRERENAQAPA